MNQDSEEEREIDEETEQSQFQNHHETNHHYANQPEEDKYRQPSFMGMLFRCAVSTLVGVAVGFIIEKSRVFEPVTVRNQTVMKNLSIMKFVMSAVASGMFGLSVLAMVPPSHFKFQKVCLYFYSSLSDKGIIASVLGGWMLGAGMTISGGDPVIVLVQLGAGVKNSYYTVSGLFFGTLIFGILRPLYETITRPVLRSSTNPWAESSYFITALPLVAMFGMLSFAFEIIIPWADETKTKTAGKNVLTYKAWPPHLCGAVVGLLQIPMVLGAEQLLGGSNVYATLISQIFVGPLRKVSPFLRRFRTGYQNWWQIFYIVGLIFGAHQSASFSHTLTSAKSVHEYHALVGGFLMAFGVLLAGGATFVHGITGMGLLSILSFITIGAAFSAAILMGVIMSYAGILIT